MADRRCPVFPSHGQDWMPRPCSCGTKITFSEDTSLHSHPPFVHILVPLVEEGAIGDVRVPELEPEPSEGVQGRAAGFVVVEAAYDGSVAAEIGEGPAEVGDGVQDQDVRGRDDEVVAGQPGEEVEEPLEDGHGDGSRPVREHARRVDGRDARLGGGLETGGRLERVAAAVVQEADVVIGPSQRLPAERHLPAVAGRQGSRNAPFPEVIKEIRRMEVLDPDDAVHGCPCQPGRSAAGGKGRARPGRCRRRERMDVLRRLGGRTVLAPHDQVDVATPDAGAVVVPDVPVGIDVERGVPVLAEGGMIGVLVLARTGAERRKESGDRKRRDVAVRHRRNILGLGGTLRWPPCPVCPHEYLAGSAAPERCVWTPRIPAVKEVVPASTDAQCFCKFTNFRNTKQ